MANAVYKKQVGLLLNVLPEIDKEKSFAIHGGTAINLFVRDMPRLSVDIDLTYVPIEDRDTSLANIDASLKRIKANVEKAVAGVHVVYRHEIAKLQISAQGADIKLEVNLVGRGILSEPVDMQLCEKAQNDFDAFSSIQVVPFGQLYGGKICAALDRQHPGDLFDVKYMLENEGFSEEVKKGFLYSLLGSNRPIREILNPNFQDQRSAMDNQFAGMTTEAFSYEEYEAVRVRLVQTVQRSLNEQDKAFLLSVKNLTPDWSIYNFAHFPSIAWKLQQLSKLKETNPRKHQELYKALKQLLDTI